jgi:hypothetical protein
MNKNTNSEKKVVTRKLSKAREVGEVLAMTPRNVLYLAAEGKIPSYRLGVKCVRFYLPEVLTALGVHLSD